MIDRVGQQLGNYRLVRLLGRGGFAEVYLGEHIHLGTEAAIKVLHTQLAREDVEQFRLEARIIARLEHPHIVRVLDFGVEGTTPFLVMSFAAGGTLRQLYPKGTRLELPTVVSYVSQVAAALQYAHDQKLIHRDVKPENILLGRNLEVLLSDFGIALVTQTSRHQPTLPATGTVAYMAPEQIQGKPRPASDQYSLGIIVYEWLSGTLPFTGSAFELFGQHLHVPPTPLREKVLGIPAAVEQVVMLALAKDPHQRFGSVQAFATALEQASLLTSDATLPSRRSPLPPPPPAPDLPPPESPPALAEHLHAQLLKEATARTHAWEDTATVLVLAQALVKEGLKQVSADANPMQLTQGIERGTEAVVAYIRNMAIPLEYSKEIAQIAALSAADQTIGQLIADVMEHVGKDGVITVEESRRIAVEVEYVEGMQIDKGYISPDFVTNTEKMEAFLDNPYILITEKKVSAVPDILPVLERRVQQGRRDILIIAEDVDGEALETLVVNKLRGILNILAVDAPGFGDRRREMLHDIAVLTGGQVISGEWGSRLDNATLADLGSARLVIAHKDDTAIVEGRGNSANIQARISQIKAQIEETTSDYDREKLQERLAKLSGGVARIKVGADTVVERASRKASVEHALAVARAAIEEGLVPGGGVALLNAVESLDQVHLQGDAATGMSILRRSLEEPLRQLALSRGRDGSVIIEGVRRAQKDHQNKRYGYNMLTDTYEDLLEAGIADAAKVTCSALQKATRLATTMLTVQTLGHPDAVTVLSESQQPTLLATLVSQSSIPTELVTPPGQSALPLTVDAKVWSPASALPPTQRASIPPVGTVICTYRGHSKRVTAVAWSPDSTRITSGSGDRTVQVWDATTGKTLLTYKGHTSFVLAVAWSPDGARIASGDFDNTVQMWDAATGKTLFTYRGHSEQVNAVVWSPDGRRIASGSDDKTIQVWDAATGKTLLTYHGHADEVQSVAWSPDSTRLASGVGDITFGKYDTTVQVWDAATGKTLFTYRGHSITVIEVAWSPDGRRIASASADSTVQVWQAP